VLLTLLLVSKKPTWSVVADATCHPSETSATVFVALNVACSAALSQLLLLPLLPPCTLNVRAMLLTPADIESMPCCSCWIASAVTAALPCRSSCCCCGPFCFGPYCCAAVCSRIVAADVSIDAAVGLMLEPIVLPVPLLLLTHVLEMLPTCKRVSTSKQVQAAADA